MNTFLKDESNFIFLFKIYLFIINRNYKKCKEENKHGETKEYIIRICIQK